MGAADSYDADRGIQGLYEHSRYGVARPSVRKFGAKEAEMRFLPSQRIPKDGRREVVRRYRLHHLDERRGDIHRAGL